MSGNLTRFRIEALHNIHTIDVKIEDNKLVLVGENGTGKSTIANFIYFFLTRQWRRMLDCEFKNILAVLDSREVKISRDDIIGLLDLEKAPGRLWRRLPPNVSSQLESLLRSHSFEELLEQRELLAPIAAEINLPLSLLMDYCFRLQAEGFTPSEKLTQVEQDLAEAIPYKVLYLPTYRRIEQDLRSIFPGLEGGTRDLRDRLRRRAGAGFIELVEFGMEDVERTIQSKMSGIKDNVRTGLNNLTGTYLRDVIRGAYLSADLPSKLKQLDDVTINAIFSRIPAAILSSQEHERLKEIITKIQRIDRIDDEDQVVAHFLAQLIELHKSQQEDERDVREFVRVCNGYLSGQGKEIVYDSLKFEIRIIQRYGRNDSQELLMKMLSSGEKQIVSLFSQIYLSGGSGFFVIIDEPELSLSVTWQKSFLPDILETGRCSGLIAVTHSPFVFENQLDKYTHSVEEFMESANVIS